MAALSKQDSVELARILFRPISLLLWYLGCDPMSELKAGGDR
jgi:hypothetical protein